HPEMATRMEVLPSTYGNSAIVDLTHPQGTLQVKIYIRLVRPRHEYHRKILGLQLTCISALPCKRHTPQCDSAFGQRLGIYYLTHNHMRWPANARHEISRAVARSIDTKAHRVFCAYLQHTDTTFL